MLKRFLGPDGLRFVWSSPDDNLKLVFGLGIDGFNTYRNIQAIKEIVVDRHLHGLSEPPS